MLDPTGHAQAEDDLLGEFAAALFGEIGARAVLVAEAQAGQSNEEGVAARWHRIADKIRALG